MLSKSNFIEETLEILPKIEALNLIPEERQKIKNPEFSWFVTVDSKKLAYFVLTDLGYPERHAYGLIREIQEELFKLSGYYIAEREEIKKHSRTYLPRLFLKYDDLASIDGLYRAELTVKEISDKMKENISTALDNRNSLLSLEDKTEFMKEQTKEFFQGSDELAKLAKARNQKMLKILFVLVGGVTLTTVLYFVL